MITQIFTNSIPPDSSSTNIINYAVGMKSFYFSNDRNNNCNTLNLPHDFDCYIPHTLVISLYPSQNQQQDDSESEFIYNVCHLFHKMRLVLQISEQTVLQLPLSLLCELNRVELHDRKLHIRIPFEALFNKINMIELSYSTVSFLLLDAQEISNYSNSFSLLTKVYMHDEHERSWISNNNRANNYSLIQQIGTLYVSVPESSLDRRSFQIQTNILNGPTKGFLIQCNITELTSIQFYINNLLRVDYERYLIQNTCVKLSNNLLYMPFNDHVDFLDKSINTFSGAINLSRLENSTMCLQFSSDQPQVVIHNVYYNFLQRTNGLGGLRIDYRPAFIENSVSYHPIQPIVGTPPTYAMLDMSGNYITRTSRNPGLIDMSGNYFINSNSNNYINSSSYGRTGSNSYSYTGSVGSATTGTVGSASAAGTVRSASAAGSSINDEIDYSVPTGAFVFQVINPERNVCNITHDEILADQQYMTCCNCHIHFLESALKRWLRARSPAVRTCPTCREVWTNFTVYINRT
jgi:hypothetical protein